MFKPEKSLGKFLCTQPNLPLVTYKWARGLFTRRLNDRWGRNFFSFFSFLSLFLFFLSPGFFFLAYSSHGGKGSLGVGVLEGKGGRGRGGMERPRPREL